MTTRITALLVLLLGLAASPTHAEEEKEVPRWKGNVELGYVKTSGNTDDETAKAAFEVKFREGHWRNVARGDYLNAETDGDATARRYFINNRTGYTFTERDYIWLSLSHEDDDFNGFKYTSSFAIGYGRVLLETDTMDWLIEAGPGYRFSKTEATRDELTGVVIEEAEEQDEAILRFYSEYQWRLSETSSFDQILSSEVGNDNTISRSMSSLTLRVIGALNVKLSYEINHNKEAPDDKDNTDTITSVTFLYAF